MYKLLPILLFAYGLAITTEDIYDNSYALLIGIDKYQNVRSLDYAVKDAEDIQSMLVDKFHFQQDNIVLLKDEGATKTSIIQEFSNITKKAESNDRVLIFFAGHGETEDLPDGGEMGYLLPVDGNNTDLYISAIEMDEIQTISLRSEAKHILYLIDACYGGIASVGARSLDANSTPDYLQKITQYKSRQIISAGGRGEQVIEKSEWGHSAFTKNLLSGLRDSKADTDSDGIITAQELGIYLKKKVTIDSNNQQTPKTRNLTTDEGEFVFLIGPTGSGKTTLLNLLYMEIFPESGRVTIGKFDSDSIKKRKIPVLRRTIGIISQNYYLLDDRNLFDNVALPLHVIGHNQNDIAGAVEEILEEVGLSGLEDHYPQELSGGEQQRACLARALIKDPDIILADEPTGNLDPVSSFDLIKLLEEINSEGTTVFMASHNYSLIKSRNHRIVEIHNGKLRSQ